MAETPQPLPPPTKPPERPALLEYEPVPKFEERRIAKLEEYITLPLLIATFVGYLALKEFVFHMPVKRGDGLFGSIWLLIVGSRSHSMLDARFGYRRYPERGAKLRAVFAGGFSGLWNRRGDRAHGASVALIAPPRGPSGARSAPGGCTS